jgi:hypothetical protein
MNASTEICFVLLKSLIYQVNFDKESDIKMMNLVKKSI